MFILKSYIYYVGETVFAGSLRTLRKIFGKTQKYILNFKNRSSKSFQFLAEIHIRQFLIKLPP